MIGYDVLDKVVAPNRRNRFWTAAPDANSYPYMMVDSGQQVFWNIDVPSLLDQYSSMIDPELGRPPQADITAQYSRVGNHFQFNVQVTNRSTVTLSDTQNRAMVHAIVYETFTNTTRPADFLTNNFVRVTAAAAITQPLGIGATGSYTLSTPDLANVVNWANLRMLVLVDYRPNKSSGPYDMLQAAFAQPASSYTITPTQLAFLIDSKSPADQTQQIHIDSASPNVTWSAGANASWMSLNPASGSAGTPLNVKVTAGALASGTQSGTVTIHVTDGGDLNSTETVPVRAYLGTISKVFLPDMHR